MKQSALYETPSSTLERLRSIEDRGQIDRVTTPTRVGLRRYRWPRLRHASPR